MMKIVEQTSTNRLPNITNLRAILDSTCMGLAAFRLHRFRRSAANRARAKGMEHPGWELGVGVHLVQPLESRRRWCQIADDDSPTVHVMRAGNGVPVRPPTMLHVRQ